ncbi:hypothetical protein [Paenibacillus spongiae]|uniref:Uncharacterized protein n=1 Tax=Paenibacillus spongiae TaxID=2909671 RepID=A0ABY5S175_9BACL|nr:hypothetical protein [Paenibacillus spongiae]UVI27607.1 hypothetical protein L1F29_19260 [Paenibacillus spongiae]
MKRYFKQILVGLCICLLLFIAYSQYTEKKMYESVISNQLQYDMISLAQSIIQNAFLYGQIMESGEITLLQADSLARHNDAISSAYAHYALLAVDFNRLKDGFQYNKTSLNAQKIALYFSHWEENHGNAPIVMDAKVRRIMTEFQLLNSKWVQAVEENRAFSKDKDSISYSSGEHQPYDLSNPYWLELLVRLEDMTVNVLTERKLDHIGQIYEISTGNR